MTMPSTYPKTNPRFAEHSQAQADMEGGMVGGGGALSKHPYGANFLPLLSVVPTFEVHADTRAVNEYSSIRILFEQPSPNIRSGEKKNRIFYILGML